jgi:hypothetical protein
MKRAWLASIIVLALAVIGVMVYLARPRADETGNAPAKEAPTPAQAAPEPSTPPSTLATCIGPMNSQTSKADLAARHKWADSLLLKSHTDAALAELRNIATLNPGYPAINLEISDALLKSKHASEAKDAINLQLEISECLSKLPAYDVQVYCESEWESVPQGGCVQALTEINQKSQYEAGLIDAGLARAPDSSPAPPASVSTLAPKSPRVPPRPIVSPTTGTVAATQPSASGNPAGETVVPKPPSPLRIPSIEASEHIGQRATVCGVVVSKNTAEQSNGKPTFVNLDRSFPQQTFTIVIWGKDSPAVGDFPAAGRVCVTGTIDTYRGNPQIAIHDAQSWYRSSQP